MFRSSGSAISMFRSLNSYPVEGTRDHRECFFLESLRFRKSIPTSLWVSGTYTHASELSNVKRRTNSSWSPTWKPWFYITERMNGRKVFTACHFFCRLRAQFAHATASRFAQKPLYGITFVRRRSGRNHESNHLARLPSPVF